jgi:hypothetical protein
MGEGVNMNIGHDILKQFNDVARLAEKNGKQVESIDIFFDESVEQGVKMPKCGWNRIVYNYTPLCNNPALGGNNDTCEGCLYDDERCANLPCQECKRAYIKDSVESKKREDLYICTLGE